MISGGKKEATIEIKTDSEKKTGGVLKEVKAIFKLPYWHLFFYAICIFQFVLSIIWIFKTGIHIGFTPDSYKFIEAARKLQFDEYTGLLYPIIINIVFSVFSEKIGIYVMYILQYVILLISLRFLLKSMGKESISGLLFLMSFPLTLHEIFLISSYCFATAIFIWFLGIVLCDDYNCKDLDLMFPFSLGVMMSRKLLYAMIMVWIMNIIVTVYSSKLRKDYESKAKSAVSSIIHLILVIAISVAAQGIFISHIGYNKMPASLGTSFMSNIAFEHLEQDYYYWPEEIKAKVPFESLSEISKSKEYVITDLGKLLSNGSSYEDMKIYSWEIAFATFFSRTKEVVMELLNYCLEYFFTPFTMIFNLCGIGKSITGYRMLSFRGTTPFFSIFFYSISFILLALYIFLISVNDTINKVKLSNNDRRMVTRSVICWILFSVFWGIFSDDYFDYFKMFPLYLIWITASIPNKKVS